MNTQLILSTLFKQNEVRYDQLWDDLLKLSQKSFNQPFEPDNLSIADHLMMVLGELRRWIGFIEGERDNQPSEPPLGQNQDLVQLHNQWSLIFSDISGLIHQEKTIDLNQSMEGIQGPIWEVLVHMMMVAEEHHHYIVTILAQMGVLERPQRSNRDLWQFQTESLPDVRSQRTISC
ncbi:MAG: hypothetical protein AAGD96_19130 [Chloroflexota bacterium]